MRGVGRPSTVSLALAAATAVLALASAAVEPYLAAAGNAASATELQRVGPIDAGLRIDATGTFSPTTTDQISTWLETAIGGETTTRVSLRAAPVTAAHGGGEDRVRLVAATGALDDLSLLDGPVAAEATPSGDGSNGQVSEVRSAGGGLYVPELLADETGLRAGDPLEIVRSDRQLTAYVAGIYRDLDPATAPAALLPFAEQAEPDPNREQRPLDLVFGDVELVLALTSGVRVDVDVSWQLPVTPELAGRSEARSMRGRMLRVARAAEDPQMELGALVASEARTTPSTHVGLSGVVRDADRAVAALTGPARGVGVAGQAVALAVVAAAALFAARGRSVELRLGAVRGQAVVRQGAHALARGAPAMLVGAGVGWAAAMALVSVAGPPGSLPSGTGLTAARDVVFSLVPAALTVLLVTGAVAIRMVQVGRRRRWTRLANVPWELVPASLALAALVQLRGGGGLALESGSPRLSPLVLAFPVLILSATAGLGVRLARRALPALRRVAGHRGHAGYLAARRLAAASGQGLALAAACALALGLVVYTATLTRALETAVEEKSVLQLGADAVATGEELDASAAGATEVLRGRGRLAPGDAAVDVLLVDAVRFAEVAYWDPALGGGRSLTELLVAGPVADGERLPVIAAGLETDPAVIDLPGFRVPVTVLDRVEALPGMSTARPLLIAPRDVAAELVPSSATHARPGDAEVGSEPVPDGRWSRELWASGAGAAERLADAGASTVRTSDQIAEAPRLVAVTWSLAALQALAVLATALALVGVLLFVASRQRDTQVSYALARRMGLPVSTHRRALSGEVLALLAIALVAATLVGVLAAALVASGIDPLPDLRPAPRAAWPLGALALLAGTLAAGGLAGAMLLQRGADRANVAEVLRRG